MDCRETQRLMDAFVDRELDDAAAASVERHLDACDHCADGRQRLTNLALAARRLRHTLPPGLESAVRSSIRADAETGRGRSLRLWRSAAAAACLVAAASLAGVLIVEHNRPGIAVASADVVAEAVDSHVRSLMADHLLDVKSSDQHTVKPWFAGRVDFSPDVRDFAAKGYPLAGGRLDYLSHRTAAALVYRHRAHVINAFTCPATQDDPAGPLNEERNGYNVLRWRDGPMMWCLVSDASAATLAELRRLIETRSPAAAPVTSPTN